MCTRSKLGCRQFDFAFFATAMLVVVLWLVALPAASAQAAALDVLRDCNDNGEFDSRHSKSDLGAARGQIPSDIEQYSDCKALIDAELLRLSTNKGSNNRDRVIESLPPRAQQQIAEDLVTARAAIRRQSGDIKLSVGGKQVSDGPGFTLTSTEEIDVPTPVLISLIGLGLLVLAALGSSQVVARGFGSLFAALSGGQKG